MFYNITKLLSKNIFWLLIILVLFLFSWDLSNLDALRQGTEGFYLQISKEMFEKSSFLTPYYLNTPHWSKPPLHFFTPFPLYSITYPLLTFSARFSVVLISIMGLFYISSWMNRHFLTNKFIIFSFFASSIGFIKYSRIFMMEIPLTIYTCISLLAFYSFISKKDLLSFITAIVFAAISVHIKGPVSLVMIGLSLTIFIFLSKRIKDFRLIKNISIYLFFSTLLGSVWFLLAYQEYGNDFFNYFFLRENLGKFSSKSYPITHVIQGLLLFSLPWSLLLFTFCSKKNFSKLSGLFIDQKMKYLLSCFIACFFLWMIPSQRSHHYAMPSLPFFLMMICAVFFSKEKNLFINSKLYSFSLGSICSLNILLLIIMFISLYLPFIFNNGIYILIVLFTIAFLVLSIASILKRYSFSYILLFHLISFNLIWSFITPIFILPTVPQEVVEFSKDKKVAVVYRKPFFIEQALNKKIEVFDPNNIAKFIGESNQLYLMPESIYNDKNIENQTTVAKRWPVWKRGRKFREILEAVYTQNLDSLKENLVLLRKR